MPQLHRIEVSKQSGRPDPFAQALKRDAAALGLDITQAHTARIYLLQADLSADQLDTLCARLLADPVTEQAAMGAAAPADAAAVVEVHPLPGVMDPVAQSVRNAIKDMVGIEADVSTGWRYDIAGISTDQAEQLAGRLLANPVIHAIHTEPYMPDALPRGQSTSFKVTHVPIRGLSDDELETLSRDAHLFLSLGEMKGIQDEYKVLEREPTDIELETLAQTWSEHCVHKTLKSRIRYTSDGDGGDGIVWEGRPGHTVNADGSVMIENLLKSTVAAATHELIADGVDWTLSVFDDNSGIIVFDDDHGICVKVETHNHPSAIEPYGGAATGIGGCIRDIIGTGLAAKPIASTDVFCVAHPGSFEGEGVGGSEGEPLPAGCLSPRRILMNVVGGVRDYGNRMGIPTVNGAVSFDDRYVGNPLVFVGCVGILPRELTHGDAQQGDIIVALGGRTGRDGIHGATFSSAELTDTHADEFSHAVQIGNAIEEKRVLDAILRARDEDDAGPLFSAITDCGAGGFSSAVGEMGEKIGADVHLDRAPLKYEGLTYTEIWISEAQERMVMAVCPGKMDALRRICDEEHVELADLGTFGTPGAELVLNYRGNEVGRMPMAFLHDGIPTPVREAEWSGGGVFHVEQGRDVRAQSVSLQEGLLRVLAHPDVASKHWIVRQYDHEVQGNVAIKPLVGPGGRGPGDASVIEPVPGTGRGLAIGCGLATGIGDPAAGGDPYQMALAAIDECVRNLVCVGADPDRIAILDNFCWPSCTKPENLGSLVRAAEGCYDGAMAYRTPFVSGKDSLNNQFTTEDGRTIEIPPTLLITGIGIVEDIARCVTMDAKRAGNVLLLVGESCGRMGGSVYERVFGRGDGDGNRRDAYATGGDGDGRGTGETPMPRDGMGGMPALVLGDGPRIAKGVAGLIGSGLVRSAHDCSDGGLLCAVAEMLIAGGDGIGVELDLSGVYGDVAAAAFCESPSRYVLEVRVEDLDRVRESLGDIAHVQVGKLTDSGKLTCGGVRLAVGDLAASWLGTLDW